jgi:hypothetical protein
LRFIGNKARILGTDGKNRFKVVRVAAISDFLGEDPQQARLSMFRKATS